ncbi:hypothetical protein OE88DRAFT_1805969 [Heliocybe sulcata]|uniref:F-box domain-containing protein n=1 Tax=Heliocybe sulcata TaxID=5364 RepID=A0A5C3NA15_9AGAM|nr:hypothetical protein OE88DRAFT_1805969 [Heliocybe sulcata]
MHALLGSADILYEIFGQLADEYDAAGGYEVPRRSLHNTMRCSALTCRNFMDPALDALWRNLDSLQPLFRLFECFSPEDGRLLSTQPVGGYELQRYRAYARRVRRLKYNSILGNEDPVGPAACIAVYHALGSPLLPSLRVLVWSVYDGTAVHLSTLVAPTLQIVSINVPFTHREVDGNRNSWIVERGKTRPQAVSGFLYELARTAPDVHSLTLRGVLAGVELDSVSRLRSLKDLAVTGHGQGGVNLAPLPSAVTFKNLLEFSCMKSLTCLCLKVTWIEIPANAKDLEFSSVRAVKLYGRTSKVAAFLALLRRTALRDISVWQIEKDDVPDYPSLFRSLAFPGLRILSVNTNDFVDQNRATTSFKAASLLEPLLGCSELVSVRVVLHEFEAPMIHTTNRDLLSMAQAWPSVTDLTWYVNSTPGMMPTIQGPSAFADHCPSLESLSVTCNVNITFQSSNDIPFSRHPLRRLSLHGTHPDDVLYTAQWVYYLFPFVRDVVSNLGTTGKWNQLQRTVDAFQGVRSAWEKQVVAQAGAP